jgi:hypothetical protein
MPGRRTLAQAVEPSGDSEPSVVVLRKFNFNHHGMMKIKISPQTPGVIGESNIIRNDPPRIVRLQFDQVKLLRQKAPAVIGGKERMASASGWWTQLSIHPITPAPAGSRLWHADCVSSAEIASPPPAD